VLTDLKRLAQKDADAYLKLWRAFGRYLKQGLTISPGDRADIEPLLRFQSSHSRTADDWYTLDDYIRRMVTNQTDIYYVLADDFTSAGRSPHLDAFRARGIEVLYLTDPVDPIMLMGLTEVQGHKLRSVDEADIDLRDVGQVLEDSDTAAQERLPEDSFSSLRRRFVDVLGDRVRDVREARSLTRSPARLVSDESGAARNMYRINRLLDREVELPVKTLELNPKHPLMHNLAVMIGQDGDNPLISMVIEQVFETALLQDGLHPDPAAMANRLTLLMQAATGSAARDLNGEG
jgi:molecular chaperone HtpG